MIYEVTNIPNDLRIIPETELEEIAQNIQMIISTQKMSVPLHRNFGVSTAMLDNPISLAQAKLAAEIVSAVKIFEPRAYVTEVLFTGNFLNGEMKVKVLFKLIEKNLRGGVRL